MSRSLGAWLLAGASVALAAFLAGRALHPEAAVETSFDLSSAAYEAAESVAGLSKGGFSGFTEAGGDGRTVIAGRVVMVSADSITVEGTSGQRSTIRLPGQGPLRRLEPSMRESLRPGVTVLVRRQGEAAEAVLVVAEP
ncbi:MAG TPA: hypothetical protein VJB57_00240 [Dehalococcoidia bacterium]|nr:hypothetical protein [Dehalococcoidia bacterium]